MTSERYLRQQCEWDRHYQSAASEPEQTTTAFKPIMFSALIWGTALLKVPLDLCIVIFAVISLLAACHKKFRSVFKAASGQPEFEIVINHGRLAIVSCGSFLWVINCKDISDYQWRRGDSSFDSFHCGQLTIHTKSGDLFSFPESSLRDKWQMSRLVADLKKIIENTKTI